MADRRALRTGEGVGCQHGDMAVHHLNCGTMEPPGTVWWVGRGDARRISGMVCHVVVVEGRDGLVLVDSGIGLADIDDPARRLGRQFVAAARPRLDRSEAAIEQVRRLGYRARDVRDVVVTHLDLDHAGGLADFPWARVHVYQAELDAALERATIHDRFRYRPAQWAHGPRWRPHVVDGEQWEGFACVRALDDGDPDVLLVPLLGHSHGHCGVAVRDGDRWLLHAGDAYFHHREVGGARRRCPVGLELFQRMVAVDDNARQHNQRRLRGLVAEVADETIDVFCAHDPVELDRSAAAGG